MKTSRMALLRHEGRNFQEIRTNQYTRSWMYCFQTKPSGITENDDVEKLSRGAHLNNFDGWREHARWTLSSNKIANVFIVYRTIHTCTKINKPNPGGFPKIKQSRRTNKLRTTNSNQRMRCDRLNGNFGLQREITRSTAQANEMLELLRTSTGTSD